MDFLNLNKRDIQEMEAAFAAASQQQCKRARSQSHDSCACLSYQQHPVKNSCCSKVEELERQRLIAVGAQLKGLSSFLKEEREVLKSIDETKIAHFYQKRDYDSVLVAQWRSSGSKIYEAMREKCRRLAQMEAKFGTWEEHFEHFDDEEEEEEEEKKEDELCRY